MSEEVIAFQSLPQFTMKELATAMCESSMEFLKTVPIAISSEETVQVSITMLRKIYDEASAARARLVPPNPSWKFYLSPHWVFEGQVHSETSRCYLWAVQGYIIGTPWGLGRVTVKVSPEFPDPDDFIRGLR
ncbi:hypothetical protein [Streptomyces sp. NPDC051662]|uniref:hypothetical protein n=1 Tax=Streptomyces sp. NPDC051662 TaxID=3154750 RepID=UPI003438CDB2